ncbi:MAG: S8 family peptidase [Acidobacteriota bacterium]|nr:S8 family peptidase [Acidobacteriota bacterium]
MKKIAALFLVGVVASVAIASAKSKTSPELSQSDPQSVVHVIVGWNHIPGAHQHRQVTRLGGSLTHRYQNLKAGAYTLSAGAAMDLANDPDVAYVAVDRPVKPLLDYTTDAVNAAAAWNQNLDGTGIGVAVIDSGMIQSRDLTNRNSIVYNQDFTGEFTQHGKVNNTANAPDVFGHGQHVAGIIASSGASSSCGNCTRVLKGVAPGVSLINLRVLDENGTGTDSEVIAAIDQAIALKDKYNIRVINLSLGRPVYESYTQDPLCQAVEQAWKAGIVVVVAAGNDGRDNSMGTNGYGTITAPGNDPFVITVGAMKAMQTMGRTDDLIASYSSKGPTVIDYISKPDIVAPGNLVASLLAFSKETLAIQSPANNVPVSYYSSTKPAPPPPNGAPAPGSTSPYFTLSGTSMATPVVSGAVADLLEANPSLTPDQVKARLMLTAYKTFPASSTATDPVTGQSYISYYDAFTVGAGYLDIAAALSSTALAPGSAMSPAVDYDPSSGAVYLVGDSSAMWLPAGAQGVFSVQAVWGINAIDATRANWGQLSATRANWGQISATRANWGQVMCFSNATLSDLAGGLPTPTSGITASNATAAESTPVTIVGEQ